jgi:energy-coupling factor transporter ATP-binding protein EcfA2
MITSVKLHRFKRFRREAIALSTNGTTLLAGPNNSGKSTLLHALAVWNFCVFVLSRAKGAEALKKGFTGQGLGISNDDFNPINLPDLKHLWYGLKTQLPGEGGYSLSISVSWDHPSDGAHELEISLSLTNDRLFIKTSKTTLSDCGVLPELVYLPPVAGLNAKEHFATPALRRAMLGRGLAGSILRNVLLDLRLTNYKRRNELKREKSKISSNDLKTLRQTDPWEQLQKTLRETFGFEIVIADYDPTYHTTIQAYTQPVAYDEGSRRYRNSGTKRDLMVEGAGALQWICVYAYAVDPETTTLLLDEPDAHLHSSLQSILIDALNGLVKSNNKQVLIATHSREVLLDASLEKVISFEKNKPRYLASEADRVRMFSGLGEDYDPFIDNVRKSKRVFFVENDSDFRAIKTISQRLDYYLPKIEPYATTETHRDRRKFFDRLKHGIPDICAISLRDRDTDPVGIVCKNSLRYKKEIGISSNFIALTLRRREIENYALVPSCIARTLSIKKEDLRTWWEEELGLPWSEDYHTDTPSILDGDFKKKLEKRLNKGGASMDALWQNMTKEEIHPDLRLVVCWLENPCGWRLD